MLPVRREVKLKNKIMSTSTRKTTINSNDTKEKSNNKRNQSDSDVSLEWSPHKNPAILYLSLRDSCW